MKLTEEQISTLTQKASEGAQLNDLQKVIQTEFKQNITYMETRFLISDLGINILTEEVAEETNDSEIETASEPVNEEHSGKVSVTVDEITRPGAVVNGRVTWSDGTSASWIIDQAGGLAMDAEDPTYQPPQKDIEDFQMQLRQLLGA